MFADLHLHTAYSDGTYSPEELAAAAAQNHLTAVALTDHDTVEGCLPAAQACVARGIEFLPGTELTAEHEDSEVHILGYGFDLNNAHFLAEMGRFQQVRQDRIRRIVALLNERKVPLKAEAVFEIANCRAPGRPHVARALVQAGICSSLDEAFERFLKKHRPAWVPKAKVAVQEAIGLIHEAHGVAVLAHPALNRVDHLIPMMVEAGLDGIECFHTKHSPSHTQHYTTLAAEYGLLVTGGSDCHGMNKGRPLIGTVKIPYSLVERLKVRLAERRPCG
jgi:predicted metal-dependent phosphoesterase TrpH